MRRCGAHQGSALELLAAVQGVAVLEQAHIVCTPALLQHTVPPQIGNAGSLKHDHMQQQKLHATAAGLPL